MILKIRSLVLTWELADDNPEHIDFWRITITKVAVYVVRFPYPLAAGSDIHKHVSWENLTRQGGLAHQHQLGAGHWAALHKILLTSATL